MAPQDDTVTRQRPKDAMVSAAVVAVTALVAVIVVARAPWPPGVFPKYLLLAGDQAAALGRAADISPLYSALAGRFGEHARSGLLWMQCLLHAGIAVALGEVVRRLAGRRAGLVAGLATALYPPLLVHAGIHEPEIVLVALVAAGLLAMEVARTRSRFELGALAIAGLCAGLAAWGRPTGILLIPAWAALAAVSASRGRRVIAGLVVLAAAAAPLIVSATHRLRSPSGVVVMNPGPVLYEGNAPSVSGLTRHAPLAVKQISAAHPDSVDHAHVAYRQVASAAVGRPLTVAEANAYWLRLTIEGVSAHPGDAMRRLGRKAALAFSPREFHDLYVSEDLQRRIQSLLPWGFGLLLAGLAWLPLARAERLRQFGPALAVMLLGWAIQAGFYCSARQKLPIAVALLVITPVLGADAWRGALRVPVRRGIAVALGVALVLGIAFAGGRWAVLDELGWDRVGVPRATRWRLACAVLDGRALVPRGIRDDAADLVAAIERTRAGTDATADLERLSGRGLDATLDDSTVAVPEFWLALSLPPADARGRELARAALGLRPLDPMVLALAQSRDVAPEGAWPPRGCDPVSAACALAVVSGDRAPLKPWAGQVPELAGAPLAP